ncbi:MAG: NAD(P)-dependent oxidoreductase [bacterium]
MKLGFIGVGNMGGPMCRNLIAHDHQLIVHDLNPQALEPMVAAGGTAAKSAAAVAAESEVVFASLPMPADVEAVVLGADGIAAGAKAGTVFVDLSTNAPSLARKLAATLAERDIPMLDAPVSGGVKGAEAATLAVMVGGGQAVFDRVEPLLRCIGKNIFLVGGAGAGCTVKLINNMVAFCNMAAANEGMMLGVRADVDADVLMGVLQTSSGNSTVLTAIQRKVLAGNFETEFAIDLAHKDLRLALQLGEELGTPLMIAGLVVNMMRQSTARGEGGQDITALIRNLEETMGWQVRSGGGAEGAKG